jgi:hypothetical protein
MMQREYPLRAKRRTVLFVIVFFSVCGWILGDKALANDRGLLINGLIHLSPPQATIVYWCIVGFSPDHS